MIEHIHQATGYSIRAICSVLSLPRSSFYHAAKPTPTQLEDEQLGSRIEAIFGDHRRRYGYRRIHAQLQAEDIICAPCRVRRLMAERGLKALQPRSFVPRTSDGRADKPSPNLVSERPAPDTPDQVWVGDITYIPTASGWRYLAVILDLCTRRVVGWSMARTLQAQVVTDALSQALQTRRPAPGLIFHSDRGSQYGSRAHRAALKRAGIIQSMSARANPYHNAWSESFMSTLKKELVRGGEFLSEADARTELFDYIESYYNRHRRHSSLGYQTPAEFERNLALPS